MKAKDFKEKHECAECGSSNAIYQKGSDQIICQDCGAIFEEMEPSSEKKFERAHDQK